MTEVKIDLLQVTDDQKKQIRQIYEKDDAKIHEDIELIRNWLTKQPHLPQDISDDFIEKKLLRNKFRLEQCKKKLDRYFTLRGENDDLFEGLENIKPSEEPMAFIPLRKLTNNMERLIFVKYLNPDPALHDYHRAIRTLVAIADLMLRYDYSVGDRFVVDYQGLTFGHVQKLNPLLATKITKILQEGFSSRILGIEFVNFPSVGAQILKIMQFALPEKIYKRIRVHSNLESLHNVVPKDCLPDELQGTQGPVIDIYNNWTKVLEEHHDFFVENYKRVSDEKLRIGKVGNTSQFGADGSFKKIALD